MIDKWNLVTNPDVMKFARKIKKETGTPQIRIWPVLGKELLAKLGDNSVSFCVAVENPRWDPANPTAEEDYHFIVNSASMTLCVSGDPGQHDFIEGIKAQMQTYLDSKK